MAGRHRKPPAWRTFLRSLVRNRNRVRTAALVAEITQLRATVARLEGELAAVRAEQVAPQGLSLEAPLIRLALAGTEIDRGPDTAPTEIILGLPERHLLDPRADREVEVAALTATAVAPAPARAPEIRRTA